MVQELIDRHYHRAYDAIWAKVALEDAEAVADALLKTERAHDKAMSRILAETGYSA